MPKFEFGNVWNEHQNTDAFLITTNSYIRNDGELVMGRGIAKESKDLFEGLPLALGNKIEKRCGHLGTYGIFPSGQNKIVAFQVKTHFKNDAELGLIENSAGQLSKVAKKYSDKRFDLNFPGIGWGGLNEEKVKPILKPLPDNVHIWRFNHQK